MYFKIVAIADDGEAGAPMTAHEAQEYDALEFAHLLWNMTALHEAKRQQDAGQMDLFSGRPIDADVTR